MRRVARGSEPAPKSLFKLKDGRSELDRARDHYRAPYDPADGGYGFAVYKTDEVKERLDALFHGKCAYCETFYASSAPVDVEHYRPKGAVEGEAGHPGYWWLAMAWENLLPSCIDCNRRRKQSTPVPGGSLSALNAGSRFDDSRTVLTGKKDLFPIPPGAIRAKAEADNLILEQALLLHPCEDEPADHLIFHVDPAISISLVFPRSSGAGAATGLPEAAARPDQVAGAAAGAAVSVRGAVSIQVYGLNRLGLVQDRTRVMRRLEFLEIVVVRLAGVLDRLRRRIAATGPDRDLEEAIEQLIWLHDAVLAEMRAMAAPSAPYSAMVQAWIEAFKARLKAA